MALKMAGLFGGEPRVAAENTDFEPPTTQVRMGIRSPEGYDPLSTVSVMEQLHTASNAASAPPKLAMIGNLPVVKQFQILGVLTVAFLALAAFMVYLDNRAANQQSMQGSIATEMQMLSQRLARGSALAAQGQSAAFPALTDSRERFRANLDALVNGGLFKGTSLDATQDPAALETLGAIKSRWERVDAAATRLIDNEKSLTSLARGLETINQDNSGLLELAQQASREIGQGGGSLREVEYANQLAVLSQRIAKNANALAASDEIDPEIAFLLGKDESAFRDVTNGLAKGSDALRLAPVRSDDARATLTELAKRFTAYRAGITAILGNMTNLVVAKQAARGVNSEAEPMLADATKLASDYQSGGRTRPWTLGLAIAFALAALACLAMVAKVFLDDARLRAQDSEHENKRNQEAILRLLNEMGSLADGDLTVQASVTEDVTGAIADSINFTIEELRTLVRGINSATDQVTKATQETQAISNRLFEASQRQNREIQQASASVLTMAESINEVAQNAAQSAKGRASAARRRCARRHRGSGPDLRHERHPLADPGDVEADQAPRRIVARDRRDRRAHFRHHRADERPRAERRDPGGVRRRGGTRVHRRRRGSAAACRALGRGDEADRRDRQDDSGRHAGRGGGDGEIDRRRRRRREAVRRRRPGACGNPARVARARRPDRRHLGADAAAIGVRNGRDARHAGHPADLGRNDRGHEADERVDRPADEARRRAPQLGRRLQGVTTAT